MSASTTRKVSVTGTVGFSEIRLKEPAEYAAGMNAITNTIAHINKEAGLFKTLATLSHMNQKDGFDCPGCAWPDPETPSKLGEYCENGAKAIAEEASSLKADAAFFAKYSVEEISTWSDMAIGKCGRLTAPMILLPGSSHYQPISWENAFRTVADALHGLDHPDEAVFYTSGRSSNEAAFLYGLFARAFGTNNMPDCSNMCHESSGVALTETLGIGKGSVTLEDMHQAEVVMVIGQNPGTNHPRMLSALENCKQNGGKIITVNPLREAGLVRFKNPQKIKSVLGDGTVLTDVFLQVKINQDVALLKLIMKRLLTIERSGNSVFDQEFITNKTSGYEALVSDLDNYLVEDLLEQCGVPMSEVEKAVSLLAKRKKIIICWAMGLTQHKNGVANIKECVNLLLLKGSIGKKGAGTCPVRGHSNVQGDRSVGIMHHVSEALNRSLEKVFGFQPPNTNGLDTVHAIKAMYNGKAKVFMALGGNFVSAASDTHYTAKALQRCELTVAVSTKLNRGHLIAGKTAIILPTLGRTELDSANGKQRFITVENSMGRVHQSKGSRMPISDALRSEPNIVSSIATAYFGKDSKIPWESLGNDYDLIRAKIAAIYEGYTNYSERSKGSGFYLPNNAREGDFSKLPDGKARFSVNQLATHGLKDQEFVLMTIRSHDQFNTTIYDLHDRYRGIYNERRVVLMNPEDMEILQLKKLQIVDIVSSYKGVERRAKYFKVVPYAIPKGNLAAYFPETNVLVPIDEYADKSNTPISKSIVVKIFKAEDPSIN